jgi:hypothetical protein
MNRSISIKQLLIGLAIAAGLILLVGAARRLFGGNDTPRVEAEGTQRTWDGNKLPLTLRDIRQAGGYHMLSRKQRAWVRDSILTTLHLLRQTSRWRLRTAIVRRQVTIARDLQNVLRLLNEAIGRVNGDPDADPTHELPLIAAVEEALTL